MQDKELKAVLLDILDVLGDNDTPLIVNIAAYDLTSDERKRLFGNSRDPGKFLSIGLGKLTRAKNFVVHDNYFTFRAKSVEGDIVVHFKNIFALDVDIKFKDKTNVGNWVKCEAQPPHITIDTGSYKTRIG